MTTGKFTYEVGIIVDFTDDELTLLRDCCLGHYDARVKAAADPGGFVYGWLDAAGCEMGTSRARCSSDQLDTCAKALEQPSARELGTPDQVVAQAKARLELRGAIRAILKSLGSEWTTIKALIRLSETTLLMCVSPATGRIIKYWCR